MKLARANHVRRVAAVVAATVAAVAAVTVEVVATAVGAAMVASVATDNQRSGLILRKSALSGDGALFLLFAARRRAVEACLAT
jgi:hypothetical protein